MPGGVAYGIATREPPFTRFYPRMLCNMTQRELANAPEAPLSSPLFTLLNQPGMLEVEAARWWGKAPAAPIPTIIHQSWKSCELPARQALWRAHCARVLPAGWTLWLWTDEDNQRLIERDFPDFLPTWNAYDTKIKQIDSVRYFYLYKYGGVYMDTDLTCLRPFEDTLPMTPGIAHFGYQRVNPHDWEAVANAFLAAPPGHPFVAFMIGKLVGGARNSHPLTATGPRLLTSGLRYWRLGNVTVHRMPKVYNSLWTTKKSRHPCGDGGSHETLDVCARKLNTSVTTTFWTHTWVEQWIADGEPGHRNCHVCGNESRDAYFNRSQQARAGEQEAVWRVKAAAIKVAMKGLPRSALAWAYPPPPPPLTPP